MRRLLRAGASGDYGGAGGASLEAVKQGVGVAAIDDIGDGSALQPPQAGLELGNHASTRHTGVQQHIGASLVQARDDSAAAVHHASDVGQEHQPLGLQLVGQFASHGVAVYVQRPAGVLGAIELVNAQGAIIGM